MEQPVEKAIEKKPVLSEINKEQLKTSELYLIAMLRKLESLGTIDALHTAKAIGHARKLYSAATGIIKVLD